jgi:hypothetical protein
MHAEGKLSMKEALTRPTYWDSVPRDNEYGAQEGFLTRIARGFGILPAAGQSSGWYGAGRLTGVKSMDTDSFTDAFGQELVRAAKKRGEDPRRTFAKMARGEAPFPPIGERERLAEGLTGGM